MSGVVREPTGLPSRREIGREGGIRLGLDAAGTVCTPPGVRIGAYFVRDLRPSTGRLHVPSAVFHLPSPVPGVFAEDGRLSI